MIRSRKIRFSFLTLALILPMIASAKPPYNPGPDPKTKSGKTFIDLFAGMPEYHLMSKALMASQKFRYYFGMMMMRGSFEKNGIRALFIGQDATHRAEFDGIPGTSGFGARVQSFGAHFGLDESVATTNEYLSTIKGQYGSKDHIYFETDESGKVQMKRSSYVDNELWMLTNDPKSEILIERQKLWKHLILNNLDSEDGMKLIGLFGGAARDGFAQFLISLGAEVKTRMNPERLKNVQVPESRLVNAGGNNEAVIYVDKDGNDIAEKLLGRRLKYNDPADLAAAQKVLEDRIDEARKMMVFTGGGIDGSGVMNAAQLGGYDLGQVYYKGKHVVSLKDFEIDGVKIGYDIGFVQSAHPTAISIEAQKSPERASEMVNHAFEPLRELQERGWEVKPDVGPDGKPLVNHWARKEKYTMAREDIGPEYTQAWTSPSRRVAAADAVRLDPQTIIAGSKDKRVKLEMDKLEAAKKAVTSEPLDPHDLWTVRPRGEETRTVFDRGAGFKRYNELYATVDSKKDEIFALKPKFKKITDKKSGRDISYLTYGMDAYYTGTNPDDLFFGATRGNFDEAEALILAKPTGLDDINTSAALTGARGQRLNGLMRDLGFGDKYLVVKTVPFGMDGKGPEDWEYIRKLTEEYREVAIKQGLESRKVKILFTDGDNVEKNEIERILAKLDRKDIPVVNIKRKGNDVKFGIVEAGEEAKKILKLPASTRITGDYVDIPRSHLSWWDRIWHGTGGVDHVIDAVGKQKGIVRALVVPDQIVNQELQPSPLVRKSIDAIKEEAEKAGIRLDSEKDIPGFLKRHGIDGRFDSVVAARKACEVKFREKVK